jgi:hypothetical protein
MKKFKKGDKVKLVRGGAIDYETKVKLSQDDLDAIFLLSSLIGGNPNTTSRSVFSNVEVNHIIGLHSSFLQQGYNYNFLSKYRTGNIDFIKKVY